MCLSAAIVSPLRSKRAMTSPVSRRSKASGFTRISVRLIRLLFSKVGGYWEADGRFEGLGAGSVRGDPSRLSLDGLVSCRVEGGLELPPAAAAAVARGARGLREPSTRRAVGAAAPTSASQYGQ